MTQPDLWYVMLADGDVHRVTLDQLDEAFQAGHIDQETLVLAAGAQKWTPLGQLAGLDETPPAPRVPVTNSFRPVSVDLSDVDLDEVRFRSSGSGKKWGATLGVLAIAGTLVGVALNRPVWAEPYVSGVQAYVGRIAHKGSAAPEVAAAAAPVVELPPAANPPAAAAQPMAGTAGGPVQGASPTSATTDRLAPDLKQRLLDADKQRGLRVKARVQQVAAPASRGTAKGKFSGFTTGGSKYDPLNSGI